MYELLDPELIEESMAAGVDTTPELMDYLQMRGAKYGISAQELYDAMPPDAQSSPQAAYAFASNKDISHIEPTSKGGDPNGDNWMWEDPSPNRSRGDETMSDHEQTMAEQDNIQDAKVARRAVIAGGTIIATNVAVDALTATAVGGATVAAEAVIASVAVPLICTGAVVAGALFVIDRTMMPKKKA